MVAASRPYSLHASPRVHANIYCHLASKNWQFTKIQREFAVYRLEVEAGDVEESVGGWVGFKMAVTDIKTYYLMGILSLTYVAGAVNSFFPTVVKSEFRQPMVLHQVQMLRLYNYSFRVFLKQYPITYCTSLPILHDMYGFQWMAR